MISQFEKRMEQLKELGFKETRVGMSTDTHALLFHQIDEIGQKEWDEYITLLKSEQFYVILDEDGIPFASGINSNSPEQLKDGFLSLIESETEEEDLKILKSMTIYEIAAVKGYTVQFQDEPFIEGDDL